MALAGKPPARAIDPLCALRDGCLGHVVHSKGLKVARKAEVTGRPEGNVGMLQMTEVLRHGPWQEADVEIALTQTGWSLFSLDFDASEAVFLRTGPGTDLAEAAFCYQRQFQQAQEIMRMPLDAMVRLSGGVDDDAHPSVHLFNIGHCGSTLLHHVFNRSGAARCLSEPLFTMNLALQRQALGHDRLRELMRAGLRLLRAYPEHRSDTRLVVKHFSQATPIMADIAAADPRARHLFMYRRAEDWCNSINGFYQRLGGTHWLDDEGRRFCWRILSSGAPFEALDGLIDMDAPLVALESLSAVAWSLHLNDYRRARDAGMQFYTISYDDLLRDRMGELEAMFRFCDLPADSVAAGIAAFDEDSHSGTATRHDIPVDPLGPEDLARVRAVLANPRLGLSGEERLT